MEDDDRIIWWPLGWIAGPAGVLSALETHGTSPLVLLPWIAFLAVLSLVFCCAMVWNLCCWRWKQASSIAVVIGVYVAFGALSGGPKFDWPANWIRFLFAYPLYAIDAADRTPAEDGLIRYWWGGYGFAGLENDDYLVFDRTGRFSAKQRRAHSDGDFGLTCEIVATQPMVGRWVIVTTFNCDLDQS